MHGTKALRYGGTLWTRITRQRSTTFDASLQTTDQRAPDANVREWHSFRVTSVIVRMGSNPVSADESESNFVSSVSEYLPHSKRKTSMTCTRGVHSFQRTRKGSPMMAPLASFQALGSFQFLRVYVCTYVQREGSCEVFKSESRTFTRESFCLELQHFLSFKYIQM